MQLSTKARYAARAMVELALEYNQDPVKLKDIARRQDISLKYLEQVMFPLRVSGFVKTLKGSKGGYTLARPPEQVTLLDLVECVEGRVSPVECADNPDLCTRSEICPTHPAWVSLKEAMKKELGRISLAELASRQKEINEKNRG